MFQGSITAIVTPFKAGNVDFASFENLIERQIANGSHGVVPVGTTGESPVLNYEEHMQVVRRVVKIVNGGIKVIAGTGSNSTSEAISLTKEAEKDGADATLQITPYYNKPSQEGIFQHIKAVHDSCGLPIILYNVPGRTCTDMQNDTVLRLSELPRVVGLKDATGSCDRLIELIKRGIRDDFLFFSGEDDLTVDFNRAGGKGCISVTSNVVPKECSQIQELCLAGKFDEADAIQKKLLPLHDIMFLETNPTPVKTALQMMGLCSGELRLPLVPPSAENQARIRKVLEDLGLV